MGADVHAANDPLRRVRAWPVVESMSNALVCARPGRAAAIGRQRQA
jgi:hypothetical protein